MAILLWGAYIARRCWHWTTMWVLQYQMAGTDLIHIAISCGQNDAVFRGYAMFFLLMPMLLVVRPILVGSLPIFVLKNQCLLVKSPISSLKHSGKWDSRLRMNSPWWLVYGESSQTWLISSYFYFKDKKMGLSDNGTSQISWDIPNFMLENFSSPLCQVKNHRFFQTELNWSSTNGGSEPNGTGRGWKTSESPAENGGFYIPWFIGFQPSQIGFPDFATAHPRGIFRESLWMEKMMFYIVIVHWKMWFNDV